MTEDDEAKPRQRRQDARKRSPRACLSCRARKVRCDVAFVRDDICTNCVLDSKQCVVSCRRPHHYRDRTKTRGSNTKTVIEPLPSPKEDEDLPSLLTNETSEKPELVQSSPRHDQTQGHPEITFAYYPFLSISNLSSLPTDDVKYLESQGCFKVPESTFLDNLLRAYFRYAHPILPIINEAEFWSAYDSCGNTSRIPVMLLSAMLFVACKYVDHHVSQGLQLDSAYEARERFLRKTRLLYDQETESSPAVLAQVSLLLAHWPLQKATRSSRQWLGRAISHCRDAFAEVKLLTPRKARLCQSNLRRLLGCCILSIAEDHSVLSRVDLSHEIGRSRVYGVESKQQFIEAYEQMSSLVAIIRRALALLYPQKVTFTASTFTGVGYEFRECKEELKSWYNDNLVLSSSERHSGLDESPVGSNDKREHETSQHDPVELLMSMMYLHYETAMFSLHQGELLRLTESPRLKTSVYGMHELDERKDDISTCILNVTGRLADFMKQKYLPSLPESMISCTALPLLFYLQNNEAHVESIQAAVTVRKATKCLSVHYKNELEYILQAVKAVNNKLINIHRDDIPLPDEKPLQITSWRKLLDTRPRLYIRLVEEFQHIVSWGGPLPETSMGNEYQTLPGSSSSRQLRGEKALPSPSQRNIYQGSPSVSYGEDPATTSTTNYLDALGEHFSTIIHSCLTDGSDETCSPASLDLCIGEIAPGERDVSDRLSPCQGIESAGGEFTDEETVYLGNGLSSDWIDALLQLDTSPQGYTASQTAEEVHMDAAIEALTG